MTQDQIQTALLRAEAERDAALEEAAKLRVEVALLRAAQPKWCKPNPEEDYWVLSGDYFRLSGAFVLAARGDGGRKWYTPSLPKRSHRNRRLAMRAVERAFKLPPCEVVE